MVKESEAATNGKIQQNGQVHQPMVTHACTASGSGGNNADFLVCCMPPPPFPPPPHHPLHPQMDRSCTDGVSLTMVQSLIDLTVADPMCHLRAARAGASF